MHLANVDEDVGETVSLAGQHPQLAAGLAQAARSWRAGIEDRWAREFGTDLQGTVTHRMV